MHAVYIFTLRQLKLCFFPQLYLSLRAKGELDVSQIGHDGEWNQSSVWFAWRVHFTAPYSSASSIAQLCGGVWKVIPRGKWISSNGLKWDRCTTVFIPSTECLYLKPGGRQNYSMFEKSTLSWSIQPFILLVFLNCSLSLSQRNPEAFVVSSVKCFTILLSSGFHSGVKMPHDRRLYWKLYVIGWSKAAGTWYIKKLCCLTDFLQKSGCTFP